MQRSITDKVLRSEDVVDYRPIMTFSSEGSWIHGYTEPKPQPQIQLASNSATVGGSN